MTSEREILEYYASEGGLSSAGRHAERLRALPDSLPELVRIVQGLVLHEYLAFAYGVKVPDARRDESHLRSVEAMIDRIFAIDPRPLTEAREPSLRLVGVCHHPVLLLLAILRAKHMPARARCGFGGYFNPGFYEDHWICERWNRDERRWQLVDPQFDAVWLNAAKLDHDVLDVPRDRFLVAADAWQRCRAAEADAATFGIFRGNLRGLWFIATDLIRDLAALNRAELLPWDVWGAAPQKDQTLSADELAFFDRLAAESAEPDPNFDELRETYEHDRRLHVPEIVFNAILNRPEAVHVS